ncbi:hypothetical protein DFQ28_010082, partial [Apophysomyces sp. BC1034]
MVNAKESQMSWEECDEMEHESICFSGPELESDAEDDKDVMDENDPEEEDVEYTLHVDNEQQHTSEPISMEIPPFPRLGSSQRFQVEKLLQSVFPVMPERYDVCPNGCQMFVDESVTCMCGTSRYTDSTNSKARTTTVQLPLTRQLAVMFAKEKTRTLLQHRSTRKVPPDNTRADIFGGDTYKALSNRTVAPLFQSSNDIALSLFVDGFCPFSRSNMTMTMIMAVVLNFPPEE